MSIAKERVEGELEFLSGQIGRLDASIKLNKLPKHEDILKLQSTAMKAYKVVLEHRLKSWED